MSYYIHSNTPYIFIHIPKTAGKSIIKTLSNYYKLDIIKNLRTSTTSNDNFHSTIFDCDSNIVKNSVSFSIVRNPWDRACSWFLFRKAKLDLNADKKEILAANQGFESWLEHYIENVWPDSWFSLSTNQVEWVGNNVDYILKFENLNNDLKTLPLFNNIDLLKTRYNKSNNSRINYKDLYNNKSKKIIEKYFEEDIDTFKYVF